MRPGNAQRQPKPPSLAPTMLNVDTNIVQYLLFMTWWPSPSFL